MNRIFTANYLRETLGYSMRFDGKIICLVIDAEPFENYDYVQLGQDLILLESSCDAKIVVVVGCFPSRSRPKKREENLRRISYVSDKLFRNITLSGQVDRIKTIEQLSTNNLLCKMIASCPIVMVTPDNLHNADSSDVWNEISLVSKSLGDYEIEKLVIVSNHDGIFGDDREFIPQIYSGEIKAIISSETITGELAVIAQTAIRAIDELGIKRIHLVNGTKPDSLLVELFTKDGSGTMIYSGEYINIRAAVPDNSNGIHTLMSCYSGYDYQCEDIKDFFVAAIDDYIVACGRLQFFPEEKTSLLTSLAVNPAYVEIGRKLLEKAAVVSKVQNFSSLLLEVPKIVPWWIPSDFKDGNSIKITQELQKKYTGKKSVTLLAKTLS